MCIHIATASVLSVGSYLALTSHSFAPPIPLTIYSTMDHVAIYTISFILHVSFLLPLLFSCIISVFTNAYSILYCV